jgi:hypothetical protein
MSGHPARTKEERYALLPVDVGGNQRKDWPCAAKRDTERAIYEIADERVLHSIYGDVGRKTLEEGRRLLNEISKE